MLLWASKFATAKIECSFEMGKQTHLWRGEGNIYFAGDGTSCSLFIPIAKNVYIFLMHKRNIFLLTDIALITATRDGS